MINNIICAMLIVAHRGASAIAPENTIQSFKIAIDGVLVVCHDPTLDRTADGRGVIKNKTFAEIRELDAGGGQKIPTLKEVLNLVKGKSDLIIEIKESGTELEALKMVKNTKMSENVIIASFYHSVSLNVKSIDPMVKAGVIFRCQPVSSKTLAIDAQANIIFPQHQFLNTQMVQDTHYHDIQVFPWIIEDQVNFERARALRVDGVITNRPETIKLSYFED
ncbi:MAG: hypothetical protein BME94_03110 [Methanobacteriales archaeon Met13]